MKVSVFVASVVIYRFLKVFKNIDLSYELYKFYRRNRYAKVLSS